MIKKISYLHETDKKYPERLKIAYHILETFEHSGVFSEAFQNKIFNIVNETFWDIVNKKKTQKTHIKEFQTLFDTYCIFSENFKARIMGLYLTLFNPNIK